MQNIKSIIVILLYSLPGIQACSSNEGGKVKSNTVEGSQVIADLKAGKNIFIENKTVSGVIDFTDLDNIVMEGKGLNRSYVSPAVTFINCVFTGKITGYKSDKDVISLTDFSKSVSFTECQFNEEVTFREAVFHGNVSFNSCYFIKKASFEGSRFMGEAFFSKTNFGEEVRFQNVFFYNKSNFMDAIFGKATYFQSCVFFADAQISNTQWLAYADWSVCSFHSGCFFNYAQFKERSVFSNTVFSGRAEFLKAAFTGNSEFKNCNFYGNVKMYEAVIQNTFSLTGSFFLLGIPEERIFSKTENGKIILEQTKSGIK